MVNGDDGADRAYGSRRYERGDVRIPAEIRESGGGKQRISVLDLSRTGFRMHCVFLIPMDRTVFLTMPGFASMEATIAWHEGDTYGCRFQSPLYEPVFEHIIRSYPALGSGL